MMTGYLSVVIFSLAVQLLLLFNPIEATWQCPEACSCTGASLYCFGASLIEIPSEIPDTYEGLYLGFNGIQNVERDSLSHLGNLRLIDLTSNGIFQINDATFEELQTLETLRLPFNNLRAITVDLLSGLRSLEVLDVSNNVIDRIDPGSFDHLPNIKEINLRSNLIELLHPMMFRSLANLEIFLSDLTSSRRLRQLHYHFLPISRNWI
ncbi:hypothetical protein BSL78_09219 [Apostichopus japonicus]|uniref:LRRNT domain-containing protein n=1 Tax=Stichopus japonicus TaxID=307972 RepID=A0A2G8L0Y2_STIJA|nr:hypothetical protein BSL78_09219 [Apostichopus japonicus]